MRLIFSKRYYIYVVVFVACFSTSVSVAHADVFAPTSCEDLTSIDLVTEMTNGIEHRIDGLTADDTTKKLFTTRGTDTNPWTRNASVWTSQGTTSLDLTGVSPWNSEAGYTKGGILITPRHVVFAKHYPIANGSTLVFVAGDGTIATSTLQNQTTVSVEPSLDDVRLGVLDSDVPPSIAFYPVLSKAQMEQYASVWQIPFLITDQEEKTLASDVDYSINSYFNHITLAHFPPPATTTRYDFNEGLVGGDSGKPAFWIIADQPVLALTTTGADNGPFYGAYIDAINNAIVGLGNDGGYQVSTYDVSCFTGNETPVVTPDMFTIPENSATSTEVGTVVAADTYGGSSIAYSIISGNTGSAFTVATTSGVLTVATVSAVDFETNPSFTLIIAATDDWPAPATGTSTITVTLEDVNETVPPDVVSSAVSAIAETTATFNGSIRATGGENASSRGFVYGETTAYGATTTESGSFSTGSFSVVISDLSCGTGYHMEAFATNVSGGTGYGTDETFTTSACEVVDEGGGGGGGGVKVSVAAEYNPGNLQLLITRLRLLIAQFTALGGTLTPAMSLFLNIPSIQAAYTRDLDVGDQGADVQALQAVLIRQGKGPAARALALTGATGYFGLQTQAALREFQAALGVIPSLGFFGSKTRAVVQGL